MRLFYTITAKELRQPIQDYCNSIEEAITEANWLLYTDGEINELELVVTKLMKCEMHKDIYKKIIKLPY